MADCTCGFSTEYPVCNGTHKVVKKVKDKIVENLNSEINFEGKPFRSSIFEDAIKIVRNSK